MENSNLFLVSNVGKIRKLEVFQIFSVQEKMHNSKGTVEIFLSQLFFTVFSVMLKFNLIKIKLIHLKIISTVFRIMSNENTCKCCGRIVEQKTEAQNGFQKYHDIGKAIIIFGKYFRAGSLTTLFFIFQRGKYINLNFRTICGKRQRRLQQRPAPGLQSQVRYTQFVDLFKYSSKQQLSVSIFSEFQ